jgi:uncharacterized membrane protein YkoI
MIEEGIMKHSRWIFMGIVAFLALGLILAAACAKKEAERPDEMAAGESAEAETETADVTPETELPEAVKAAMQANVPDAEIDFVEVVDEDGVTLYDIEFKDNRGEIEVAADGTVLDVVTIITMEDLPEAAAQAIKDATEGITILRLERSEIRSEIKKDEGGTASIVKLETPRFVYEAEVKKDDQTGEITVDAEGNIIEALKWD